MSSSWPIKRLGDLTEVITKGTTPTSVGHAFIPEGINFVKVESITENGQFIGRKLAHITQECHDTLRRSQLKSGDILFSIAGALGRTAQVTDDIVPANTNQALAIIRLRPSTDVLPAFVLMALSTGFALEQIEKFKGGVAQQNLSLAQVQEFQIPIPPFPEQQRIVGILDEAFEGIATAKANAEKNLQNARALFESHLQAVFSERGDGWVEKTIEEVCIKITDGEHLRPKMTTSGVPFLSAKDVLDNDLVFTDSLFVSETDAIKFRKRCNPEMGDILVVSRGATVGRTCIVNTERVFCLLGSVILLKVGTGNSSKFISYALKSPNIRSQLMTVSEAAAQQAIYLRDIKPLIIGIPSFKEQEQVVLQLDSLNAETQRLESIYQQKLTALDALKKSLLDQAFKGEL